MSSDRRSVHRMDTNLHASTALNFYGKRINFISSHFVRENLKFRNLTLLALV